MSSLVGSSKIEFICVRRYFFNDLDFFPSGAKDTGGKYFILDTMEIAYLWDFNLLKLELYSCRFCLSLHQVPVKPLKSGYLRSFVNCPLISTQRIQPDPVSCETVWEPLSSDGYFLNTVFIKELKIAFSQGKVVVGYALCP